MERIYEENEDGFDPDEPSEMFWKELLDCLHEYEAVLAGKGLTKGTINKHSHVISSYIEYICTEHGVSGHEQVTVGMANSGFCRHFNSHVDAMQSRRIKNILKGFYAFLEGVHGIRNVLLMKGFGK